MRVPLLSLWHLTDGEATGLPDAAPSISLPGLDALADFADLLGDAVPARANESALQPGGADMQRPAFEDNWEDGGQKSGPSDPVLARSEDADTPVTLPFMLTPQTECGAILWRWIDFGALRGDEAQLNFAHLAGSGEIWLGGSRLASFQNGPLCADVTAALRGARRLRLELRFAPRCDSQEAGVPNAVFLRVSRWARLEQVCILPDAAAARMTVRACVRSHRAGEYLLRAAVLPPGQPSPGQPSPGQPSPSPSSSRARALCRPVCASEPSVPSESSFFLDAGASHTEALALRVSAPLFAPGEPYRAPLLRVELWFRAKASPGIPGALCDEDTLFCGYPGPAPRWWLPLSQDECAQPPGRLLERLSGLSLPCVALPVPASDALMLALSRAGIAARIGLPAAERARLTRFPCAVFAGGDQEEPFPSLEDARLRAVRELCSMTAYPPAPGAPFSPRAALAEAAGRALDPDAPDVREVLVWLRAVCVRLRAEALRQGVRGLPGALCLPGEWSQEDVAAALHTALAPLHVSVLPLYGAWWTRSRFTASVHAFVPANDGGFVAIASLEDEDGGTLSTVRFVCPPGGGYLGLLEASLPDAPCVLTLRARLLRGDETVEESVLPVYTGARGPLECAF